MQESSGAASAQSSEGEEGGDVGVISVRELGEVAAAHIIGREPLEWGLGV